jgi:polyhydroxyalkanoate synthesis regulator phasin
LVNTIEAIQNQTNGEASATKEDIFTVMKEAIEEGNKKFKLELHKEMKELKNDIVKEAHIYADEINEKLKKQMLDIQSTLTLALTGMQQITGVGKSNLLLNDQPNVE